MTLTICIKTKDGIVLASDSRASSLITSNDTVKKIFKLDEHTAVGIAGDGPLAIHLFDLISEKLNFGLNITDLVEQFRGLAKDKFEEWFSFLTPKDRPSLSILLGGYNDDKQEIYTLRSSDNFVPRKSPTGFECIGIPYIAEYLLNRLYEPEVATEYALEMSTLCIRETASQDRSIGGPTQLASFSKTADFKMLSQSEVDEIEKKCDKFHLGQKAYFYPEDVNTGTEKPEEAKKK